MGDQPSRISCSLHCGGLQDEKSACRFVETEMCCSETLKRLKVDRNEETCALDESSPQICRKPENMAMNQ